MKTIITIFTCAILFTACNNSKMNEQAMRDSIKKSVEDSLRTDSLQRVAAMAREKAAADSVARVRAEQEAAATRRSYASRRSGSSVQPVVQGEYYEQQAQPKKKGWSSAAKGAAIGAGAGAVTGILVDKKDARGAIIGGVVGAGTGYVIGREKDKKTGRAK